LLARPGYAIEWAEIAQARSKPVIKLVRNPFDRAVSSFLHFVGINDGRYRWSQKLWQRISNASGVGSENSKLSFHTYLRGLRNVLAEGPVNPHLAPQYIEGEEALVSRIVRLENFEPEIRRLESEFHLPSAPFDRIVESRHRRYQHPNPPGSFANVAISPWIIARDEAPAYSAFYDKDTRALVIDIYRDDLVHYGYDETSGG
jgi:hypothetical protein